MLGFDAEVSENVTGKVGQIEGDEYACAGAKGGGQYVPVVPIRQFNGVDEMLVPGHQHVGYCLVHQLPGTLQFVG